MGTKVEVKTGSGQGMKLTLVVIILALSGLSYFLYGKSKESLAKVEDLSGNVRSLLEEVNTYQVRLNDSTRVNASRVHQLSIELSDYKRLYGEEARTVQKLRSALSELQYVGSVVSHSTDTVFVPTYIDSMKQVNIDYSTKWIDITATIDLQGMAQLSYTKRDSLLITQTVERRKLLFGLIRYGEKSTYWEALSFDPKTKITGMAFKKILK